MCTFQHKRTRTRVGTLKAGGGGSHISCITPHAASSSSSPPSSSPCFVSLRRLFLSAARPAFLLQHQYNTSLDTSRVLFIQAKKNFEKLWNIRFGWKDSPFFCQMSTEPTRQEPDHFTDTSGILWKCVLFPQISDIRYHPDSVKEGRDAILHLSVSARAAFWATLGSHGSELPSLQC